jgi:hypothetical protein
LRRHGLKTRSSGLGFTLPDCVVINHVIYKHIIDARYMFTPTVIINILAHRNAQPTKFLNILQIYITANLPFALFCNLVIKTL